MKFNAFVFRKLTGHHCRIKSIEKNPWSTCTWGSIGPLISWIFFARHSVRTTIARITIWWLKKIVDDVGSAFFYKNRFRVLATSRAITKAHPPAKFTFFHCRMSSRQPGWPVSTTPECLHTLCWHSCSCSSYKTIPSLTELAVTQHFSWFGFCVSTGFTQVWVMMARISYKKNDTLRSIIFIGINDKINFVYIHIIPAVYRQQ